MLDEGAQQRLIVSDRTGGLLRASEETGQPGGKPAIAGALEQELLQAPFVPYRQGTRSAGRGPGLDARGSYADAPPSSPKPILAKAKPKACHIGSE